jgi:hypothetical protein
MHVDWQYQDVKLFGPLISPTPMAAGVDVQELMPQNDFGEDIHTTRYRFESRKGFEIRITPLLLPAASQLETEMEMKVS